MATTGGTKLRSDARCRYLALLCFAVCCYSSSVPAAETAAPPAADLVHARLVAEKSALARGKSTWLAVELTMKRGWHTYWRNPGDAGLATSVEWTLPTGVTAQPLQWPAPTRFSSSSGASLGYAERVALLVAIDVGPRFVGKQAALKAKVTWLACADICVPGSQELVVNLAVTDVTPRADAAASALFAEAQQRIPHRAPFRASLTTTDTVIALRLPLSSNAKSGAAFYPYDSNAIDHAAKQTVTVTKDRVTLVMQRSASSTAAPDALDGVLLLPNGTDKPQAFELSATRPANAP